MGWFDKLFQDQSFAKKETELINSLPAYQRKEIVDLIKNQYDTAIYQDPLDVVKKQRKIEQKIEEYTRTPRALEDKLNASLDAQTKGFPLINSSTSILGYEPAGSTLRKLYPNPFAVYSFMGNNHWATLLSRAAVREELARDGYRIVTPQGTSKKKLKLVQSLLDDLYIDDFRLNCTDMLNVFGNCWIDRDRNALGGLRGIQILLPEKVLPILDTYGDYVLGWEYIIGNKRFYFNLGEIDHLKTYNLRSMQLGNPSLAPVVVDVEADLYASVYANMMFQKGGLVRAIVSLGDSKDSPDDIASLNENVGLHFAMKIYELFSKQYSGARGANQLTFLPNVKNVYPITNPKDLEGPYKETSDRTAIKVAGLLGVQPRRIGIHTTSQYENKVAVEDAEALASDNHRYYLVNITDNYVNKTLIQNYLGFDDVELQFSGEYSSLSKSAAEFAFNIAQCGANIITVNEFRTRVMHWEPLDGADGDKYIGNVKNAALLLKQAATSTPPGRGGGKKDMDYYLEQVFGPKEPMFVNTFKGPKIAKYRPQDIRMM